MKKFTTLLMMFLMFIGMSTKAQEVLVNGGFELWGDDNSPTGWTKAENITKESGADFIHGGTYSAKHEGGTKKLGQTIGGIIAGDSYTLTLWYKVVESDGDDARIWSYWKNADGNMEDHAAELRGPNNAYFDNNGGLWTQYTVTLEAPATVTDFYFEVRTYSGAFTYWDDFSFVHNGTSTTVSTPVISPSSGDYFEAINVTMVCSTDGANIYYTTDGTDPDETDNLYNNNFSINSNTTVKAKAFKAGLDASDIAVTEYNFPTVTNVSSIAQLRSQSSGGYYNLTNEVILTYQQSYRNQKYIQDGTAGILIDDISGNITTDYEDYDGITGITGILEEYEGMLQFIPISDPEDATTNANSITPEVVTLDDLLSDFQDYQAELIKVEGATFVDAGVDFENGTIYSITDGSKGSFSFRTSFYNVDYIGTAIPSGAQDLIMIPNTLDPDPNGSTNQNFVTSRSSLDINPASSANPATQLDITSINGGSAVNENQEFTVTVQAQDVDGAAANVDADLAVTLTLGNGTGTLGGTLTGTIAAGTSTITISGITYGPHENGVVLNVAGGSLTSGSSDAFDVLEVIVPEIVISEIMYKAMGGSEDSLEYIEFYNNGSSAVNLENYTMSKGVGHTFGNVSIDAGDYLLLAKDADAVSDILGVNAEEWTSGGLNNGGEEVELSDASENVVAYVDYGTSGDWPTTETGKSIRFCNTTLVNNDPANWSISEEFLVTIGIDPETQDIYGSPLEDCGAASLNANFSADETNIEEGDNVDFTNTSTGAPTSWAWTFEGGTPATSNLENPENIVYSAAGTYDVTLVVTKGAEEDTELKTDYITVSTPTNPATKLDITAINGGNDVYENTEFSVTVNSLDAAGAAANVDADLDVTISLNTGNETLGGNLTGTILSGTSSIEILGITYGPHENGVKLDVNGGSLTMGTSAAFNVLEVVIPEIVITEIMYNAMPNTDTLEYIEFYNNGNSSVELDNFKVTEGVVHTFESFTLNAGAYVLIAKNASAIQDAFGITAFEWTSGGLANDGESVNLLTPSGAQVTLVTYDVVAPWPIKETGKSIRFCNPGLDNNDPANWSISIESLATIGGQEIFGTPMASCGVADLDAEFSANTISIETGQSVDFTDESTGTPTSWAWTFEGGTPASSTSQNPQDVVYNTAGVYDVVLTISKDGDSNTETKTEYITVVDPIIPPVASFTADVTTIFVGQSIQFNSTSTNDPESYAWTFEGGTPASSNIQAPSVSYATAGTYDVSLTVTNGGGSDDLTETDYITVLPATLGDLVITEIMYNPPEAGDDILEYVEIYNNSDETVDLIGYNFTEGVEYTFPTMDLASGAYVLVAKDADAMQTTLGVTALEWTSGSLSNNGELVKLSSPIGVTIDSVHYGISEPWPEDANGNGPSISICDAEVENSIGENWHASTLYLTDDANGNAIYGSPGTAPAPVANFSADEVSILITEDVQFTNLSSCNYTSIEWTFEGGTPNTSSDENPLVSYDIEGVFDVSLTVTNDIGSHTIEMVDYIEVIDPTIAPIADFSADLTTVFVGQSIQFTDLSVNEPVSYEWTFDGGTPSSSSLQNPNITYSTPGTYDVSLFVENTAGDDEMIKTDYITVLPATVGDLVITEIMYNPPESGDDSLEYVELYNNSADIVNLMGYSFSDGIEYTFTNVDIAANEYLIVAKNSNAMQNTVGVTALEWTSGSLSNGGELIKIISATGVTVDSVHYSDMAPWPEDGDGAGPSITICDPEAENSVGENWHASVNYLADNSNGDAIFGSPGTAPAPVANFTVNEQFIGMGDQVEFTELSTCNAETFEWTFEGGTPESSTDPNPTITYSMAGDFDVTLTVTNAFGSHTIIMEEYISVATGIAAQTLSRISVVPNPSTGLFTLENPSHNEINVMVYNVLGKLVYENNSVLSSEVIDLTREESGIYLLQLSIDGEYKTMRIIKQ